MGCILVDGGFPALTQEAPMAEAGQQRLADYLPQRRLPNISHSFPTGPDHHPLRAEVLVRGGPL